MMKSQSGRKDRMKQHYLGPEVCPHRCGAVAEVLPSSPDHVQYRCPKCGEFRVSSSVDECLKAVDTFAGMTMAGPGSSKSGSQDSLTSSTRGACRPHSRPVAQITMSGYAR
jgi:predicted RNA-binding Zn-ribbon protein involved in translation (DUF1610 family)